MGENTATAPEMITAEQYDNAYGPGAYRRDRRDPIVFNARRNIIGRRPVAVAGNPATRWI